MAISQHVTREETTQIIFAVMGEAKYNQAWCERIGKATVLPNDVLPRSDTKHWTVTLLYGSFDEPIESKLPNEIHRRKSLQKGDFEGCQSLYIPETTWTEGRNMLAKEIRLREDVTSKEFDFWVFADDDVSVHILGEKGDEASDWQGWGSFFDYLVDDMPSEATTVTIGGWKRDGVRSATTVDALVAAFPRKFVPYFIPYVTLGSSESQ